LLLASVALTAALMLAAGVPLWWALAAGAVLFLLGLRPLARRLVGVDLSESMLAKARERAVYDELACGAGATSEGRSHPQV